MHDKQRVIIIGSNHCPHCRALIRLLREVSDAVSFSYIELSDFVANYLSESERELYIKKLQTTSLGLPLSFIKTNNEWKELHAESYTKNLIVRYAKSLITPKHVN